MTLDPGFINGETGLAHRERLIANANNAEARLVTLEVSVQEDIIQAAKSAPIAPSGRVYTNGLLTTVNYTDTAAFTLQSTTLSYTDTLLTTKTHVFTYNAQVWTTTSNYTYVNGILDSSNIATVIV